MKRSSVSGFVVFTVVGAIFCLVVLFFVCGEAEFAVPVSALNGSVNDGDSAVADPFGYHNGKWSLWEYIGDSVSSLFQ